MSKIAYLSALSVLPAFSLLAMPSRSDLQKVQGAVNELMAEDVAAMKKGKIAPEKAAETALGYAREATDEASKFLFYKGAFGLYVQGRKYDEAVKAVETLTQEVKDVPDKVLADIIRDKLKRVSKKDGGAVFELYDRVDRRMRSAAERAKLEAALKANPKDAEARRQLAFVKATLGDWAGALGDFALVGGKSSDAAKAEQGGKLADAADLWWNLSDDEDERAVLREHAAGLYRQAMDGGKIQGIKLALAKKRVAEFGAEPSAPSAPAAAAAEPVRPAEEKSVAKAEVAAPKVCGRYDWTIPTNLKKPKEVDFDFGGGAEKLLFFAVAPGMCKGELVWRAEPVQLRVTYPFWISQLPVTVAQFKLSGGAELDADAEEYAEKLAGDRDFASLALTTGAGFEAYIAWLNKTYGKLLPKGWVFRPPTLAEWHLSFWQFGRRVRPFSYCEGKLKALQGKGLLTEFETEKEVVECLQRHTLQLPYKTLVTEMLNFRRKKLFGIFIGSTERMLDAASMPAISDDLVGWEPSVVQPMKTALAYGKSETDFFRWCEPDAPSRRRPTGSGVWVRDATQDCRVAIRLAVGPDIVGEWKAKHGK